MAMNTWIALLRGINVGGNHIVPMQGLRVLLARHGCHDVQTYIQSGNVVFRSEDVEAGRAADRITAAIAAHHGFAPRTLVLGREELLEAARRCPFPPEPAKSVHLYFLAEVPTAPNLAGLGALRTSERFVLDERRFYLHTPEGLGSSKLAERIERHLGVAATARNWNTVGKLVEMVGGL